MTSVELRRVSKVFSGTTVVLDQVDLCVEDGELLVLLGPNGCGKTTLLRLIAGLEHVTAGEIFLGGQVVNDWPPRRRDVAMVFQSGVLYPHLTVEQNLRFGTRDEGGVLGWIWSRLTNRPNASRAGNRSDVPDRQVLQDQQVLQDRVRETAQLLGITSLLNRLPRQLSGGERQRVALGRALVRQPAAFLLDEPVANADEKLRQELRMVFQRARQRFPGTMVLVSHDHTEALALGQRIAILGQGKIQQIGLAREVYATPRNRFVAEFLGRSSMSFVDGDCRQEHDIICFVTEYGRLQVPGSVTSRIGGGSGRVTLGLRTDAITVSCLGSTTATTRSESSWPESSWPESSWHGEVRWVELREDGLDAFIALRKITPADEKAVERDKRTDDEGIVVARVLSPEVVRPGDRVRVEINLDRTFWFDTRTGNNLAVPR